MTDKGLAEAWGRIFPRTRSACASEVHFNEGIASEDESLRTNQTGHSSRSSTSRQSLSEKLRTLVTRKSRKNKVGGAATTPAAKKAIKLRQRKSKGGARYVTVLPEPKEPPKIRREMKSGTPFDVAIATPTLCNSRSQSFSTASSLGSSTRTDESSVSQSLVSDDISEEESVRESEGVFSQFSDAIVGAIEGYIPNIDPSSKETVAKSKITGGFFADNGLKSQDLRRSKSEVVRNETSSPIYASQFPAGADPMRRSSSAGRALSKGRALPDRPNHKLQPRSKSMSRAGRQVSFAEKHPPAPDKELSDRNLAVSPENVTKTISPRTTSPPLVKSILKAKHNSSDKRMESKKKGSTGSATSSRSAKSNTGDPKSSKTKRTEVVAPSDGGPERTSIKHAGQARVEMEEKERQRAKARLASRSPKKGRAESGSVKKRSIKKKSKKSVRTAMRAAYQREMQKSFFEQLTSFVMNAELTTSASLRDYPDEDSRSLVSSSTFDTHESISIQPALDDTSTSEDAVDTDGCTLEAFLHFISCQDKEAGAANQLSHQVAGPCYVISGILDQFNCAAIGGEYCATSKTVGGDDFRPVSNSADTGSDVDVPMSDEMERPDPPMKPQPSTSDESQSIQSESIAEQTKTDEDLGEAPTAKVSAADQQKELLNDSNQAIGAPDEVDQSQDFKPRDPSPVDGTAPRPVIFGKDAPAPRSSDDAEMSQPSSGVRQPRDPSPVENYQLMHPVVSKNPSHVLAVQDKQRDVSSPLFDDVASLSTLGSEFSNFPKEGSSGLLSRKNASEVQTKLAANRTHVISAASHVSTVSPNIGTASIQQAGAKVGRTGIDLAVNDFFESVKSMEESELEGDEAALLLSYCEGKFPKLYERLVAKMDRGTVERAAALKQHGRRESWAENKSVTDVSMSREERKENLSSRVSKLLEGSSTESSLSGGVSSRRQRRGSRLRAVKAAENKPGPHELTKQVEQQTKEAQNRRSESRIRLRRRHQQAQKMRFIRSNMLPERPLSARGSRLRGTQALSPERSETANVPMDSTVSSNVSQSSRSHGVGESRLPIAEDSTLDMTYTVGSTDADEETMDRLSPFPNLRPEIAQPRKMEFPSSNVSGDEASAKDRVSPFPMINTRQSAIQELPEQFPAFPANATRGDTPEFPECFSPVTVSEPLETLQPTQVRKMSLSSTSFDDGEWCEFDESPFRSPSRVGVSATNSGKGRDSGSAPTFTMDSASSSSSAGSGEILNPLVCTKVKSDVNPIERTPKVSNARGILRRSSFANTKAKRSAQHSILVESLYASNDKAFELFGKE